MSNILEQANKIINERSEEKEREYGPIGEGFERASEIASAMTGRVWNPDDIYIAMIALKFSRQSYNYKEDNLLDAVAYIGAWQNYINEQSKKEQNKHGSKKSEVGKGTKTTRPILAEMLEQEGEAPNEDK